MKRILILLAALSSVVLAGCGMGNESIIQQTKLCHDNGMKAVALQYANASDIRKVQCIPQE